MHCIFILLPIHFHVNPSLALRAATSDNKCSQLIALFNGMARHRAQSTRQKLLLLLWDSDCASRQFEKLLSTSVPRYFAGSLHEEWLGYNGGWQQQEEDEVACMSLELLSLLLYYGARPRRRQLQHVPYELGIRGSGIILFIYSALSLVTLFM